MDNLVVYGLEGHLREGCVTADFALRILWWLFLFLLLPFSEADASCGISGFFKVWGWMSCLQHWHCLHWIWDFQMVICIEQVWS